MTERGLQGFWRWFASVADEFGEHFENEDLLKELDRRVTRLGPFAWEVGPGLERPSALTISPAGSRELLRRTEAIVQCAPEIPGWEFHPAKMPRRAQAIFEIENAEGRSVLVDASEWTFVLLQYPDGQAEAIIEAANLDLSLSDDHQRWAGEIALDGIIGEATRISLIDQVTVVRHLDDEYGGRARPLLAIGEALKRLNANRA
jgi:hypothetical protein